MSRPKIPPNQKLEQRNVSLTADEWKQIDELPGEFAWKMKVIIRKFLSAAKGEK